MATQTSPLANSMANAAVPGAATANSFLQNLFGGQQQPGTGMIAPPTNMTADTTNAGGSGVMSNAGADRMNLIRQVLNPRLDISGHMENPSAPSDFDALRASTANNHSWNHPELYSQPGYNGPQAAAQENATHSQGVEGGFTPFGTASVHNPEAGETMPPATFGPQHQNASQFFTGAGIDSSNPALMASMSRLPENDLTDLRNEHGIQLPQPAQEGAGTPFARTTSPGQMPANVGNPLDDVISKLMQQTGLQGAQPMTTRLHPTMKNDSPQTPQPAQAGVQAPSQPFSPFVHNSSEEPQGALPNAWYHTGETILPPVDKGLNWLFGNGTSDMTSNFRNEWLKKKKPQA